MDDILFNFIDDKIIIEHVDDKTIMCYSKKNKIVSDKLHEIIGLLLDLCNIVGEYHNAIVIKKKECQYSVIDEYINFKKINYIMHLSVFGENKNDCVLWFINTNQPTIYTDTHYIDLDLIVFNKYLEKKYRINNFFNNYQIINSYNLNIEINDDTIIIKNSYSTRYIHILDHELFVLMIIIIKKIIDDLRKMK